MGQAKMKRLANPNAFMINDMERAVAASDFAAVEKLLNCGFDLRKDGLGRQEPAALVVALGCGSPQMLDYLLANGGDASAGVEVRGSVMSLIDFACMAALGPFVKTTAQHIAILIRHGASLCEDSISYRLLPAALRAQLKEYQRAIDEERIIAGATGIARQTSTNVRRL